MRDSAVVTRKVHPGLTFITHLIEAFCILLFGVSMPLGIATEWRFGIANQLGDIAVNLRTVDGIVSEIPVVRQRFPIMRVKFLVR